MREVDLEKVKIHFNVVCIGAGGTGGNFLKEFGRYMSFFRDANKSITLSIVDGDHVENKNRERQPYLNIDENQPKSVTLANAIIENFGLSEDSVRAYNCYINNKAELYNIVNRAKKYYNSAYSLYREIIVLIGAVDNHRARQVMDGFFYMENDIIYIDAANEYRVGEVCIGIRMNGKNITPPRSHYFPDILKDKSPSKSELSCGVVNESDPQHLTTNLMAANICLCSVVNLIHGTVQGGIVYFDSSKMFSRFDLFTGKCPSQKKRGVKKCVK